MTILETLQKFRDDFIELLKNNLKTKVDKEEGMGLSQNSFTNEEKRKLADIKYNTYSISKIGNDIFLMGSDGSSEKILEITDSLDQEDSNIAISATAGVALKSLLESLSNNLDNKASLNNEVSFNGVHIGGDNSISA